MREIIAINQLFDISLKGLAGIDECLPLVFHLVDKSFRRTSAEEQKESDIYEKSHLA
jgi:hypothetical protein